MITANEWNKCSLADFEKIKGIGIFARFLKVSIPLQASGAPIGLFEDEPPLQAYVNHGRWVVKCECRGAEKAWEEGLFMCLSCLNSGHKHKYRKVIFPKERAAIEAILIKRPLINRNWLPGETLAQLGKENKDHKGELL